MSHGDMGHHGSHAPGLPRAAHRAAHAFIAIGARILINAASLGRRGITVLWGTAGARKPAPRRLVPSKLAVFWPRAWRSWWAVGVAPLLAWQRGGVNACRQTSSAALQGGRPRMSSLSNDGATEAVAGHLARAHARLHAVSGSRCAATKPRHSNGATSGATSSGAKTFHPFSANALGGRTPSASETDTRT